MTITDDVVTVMLAEGAALLLKCDGAHATFREVLVDKCETTGEMMMALTMLAAASGATVANKDHWQSAMALQQKAIQVVYEEMYVRNAIPEAMPTGTVH